MKATKQLYTSPTLFVFHIADDIVTASSYNIEWSWSGQETTPGDWIWEWEE
jgi:hypothetical protein